MNKPHGSPTCVFDPIIAGQAPAHVVLDGPEVLAFLDARPVFPGHTLVVPRTHYPTVADLPPEVPGLLWAAGARIAAAQRRALGAGGTFFGLNDVVSQSVPHVHLHVVPRRPRDGLRGFFWPRSRYADDAEAARTAEALRQALGEAGPGGSPEGGDAEGVRIRPAGRGDAAALAAILAAGSLRDSEAPGEVEAYLAALDEIATTPGAHVLVAESAGQVIGVCQLIMFRHLQERGGRCAEIESMHVSAGHRNRGVGAALLRSAVDAARSAGCYRVQLTSNKARDDAHRFYIRHGFEASHEGFKLYLR